MDVDDRGWAALADTLSSKDIAGWFRIIIVGSHGHMNEYERLAPDLAHDLAAAILGKRGVFLPDGVDILEGHRICEENSDAEIARLNSEIVRLRKIEAAARRHALANHVGLEAFAGLNDLRAALEATP